MKIRTICNFLNGDGIFSALDNVEGIPWKNQINALDLDLEYYTNHAGDKTVSPLIKELLNDDGKLGQLETQRMASFLFRKYGKQWERIWETLLEEYDPLHNYDGKEKHTITETLDSQTNNTGTTTNDTTETLNTSQAHTGTTTNQTSNTETKNLQTTETGTDEMDKTGTITEASKVYGFNSTTGEPDRETITTNNTKDKETKNLTTAETGTDSTQGTDTQTNNLTDTTTGQNTTNNTQTNNLKEETDYIKEITEETEKGGNLGVTTSQSMLIDEIDLRQKYNFYNIIFKNIDEVFTLDIF